MREQAPGANLLHESVSGASSLVCTEICFEGACFRSKLPRVYRPLMMLTLLDSLGPVSRLVCVLVCSSPIQVFWHTVILRLYELFGYGTNCQLKQSKLRTLLLLSH